MESNSLILGQDKCYNLNTYETGLNNNVLVVGASGAGKTMSGHYDPFWDEAAQLLVQACMAYLVEKKRADDENLHNVMKMAEMLNLKKELEFNDAPALNRMMRLIFHQSGWKKNGTFCGCQRHGSFT
jgi:hypothetical protein